MSEKINKKHEDNDDLLAPAGFDGNPSLYGEEQIIHDYSTIPTHILEAKAQRFIDALNDPTTLPAHKKIFARLIDHIVFEVTYRDVHSDNARLSPEEQSYGE